MSEESGSGKPQAGEGQQSLYKSRKKESLPWIVNPLEGLKGKEFKSFHVRHEASMIELFFDLFFVANLATFTAYHEITDGESVLAYIGFFLIMWSTWFQITIFDVRFAGNSVWERLCKLYQFIVFVIFAAIGTNFNPGGVDSDKNYRIYQLMAVILGITRFVLAIQYAITAFFVVPKYKSLRLPFFLLVFGFLISGAALLAMFIFFVPKGITRAHIAWWIIIPVEGIITVLISSKWRMLSFKDTHMNERLSLLTMIIIGEGVIGVSKTVGYLWPTAYAPAAENIITTISIVVLLFLLWQTYFDNHPHGHYGTIKQQWWALSHFFMHLGFVGVVEGSNRMAIYNYAIYTVTSAMNQVNNLCSVSKATNAKFVSDINATVGYIKLDYYDPRGYDKIQSIFSDMLDDPASATPVCLNSTSKIPQTVSSILEKGIYKKFKINGADDTVNAYLHTFRTTFVYYWSSISLSLLMLLFFLYIVRRNQHDRFEVVRLVWRFLAAVFSLAAVGLGVGANLITEVISSPWVVLVVSSLLFITLLVDCIVRWAGILQFERYYAIPEPSQDHGHGHIDGEHHEKPEFATGITTIDST